NRTRLTADGFGKMRCRVGWSSEFQECDAEIVVRLGVVWVQPKRFGVMSSGFGGFPLQRERAAQVVVSFSIVRLELQRVFEGGDCFIQPAFVEKQCAEV